jgi:hypothetical protein
VLEKEQAARAIFRASRRAGRFAGEMGGEGNLKKLREALDTELVIVATSRRSRRRTGMRRPRVRRCL